MMRGLLSAVAAAVLAAPAEAQLTLIGPDTACRSTLDGTVACQDDASNHCPQLYWVLTKIKLDQCKMACSTLGATCKGIEFGAAATATTRQRCEIWKVPILGSASYSPTQGWSCFNSTTEGADAPLYLKVSHTTNFNFTSLAAAPASVQTAVKAGAATIFVQTLAAKSAEVGYEVTTDDVMVSLDAEAERIDVYLKAPNGSSVVFLYQLLRPTSVTNANDGVAPVTSALLTTLNGAAAGLSDIADYYQDGESAPGIDIHDASRTFIAAWPQAATTAAPGATTAAPGATTAAPGATTAAPGGGTNQSAARNANGAASRRPLLAAALGLAGAGASAFLGLAL